MIVVEVAAVVDDVAKFTAEILFKGYVAIVVIAGVGSDVGLGMSDIAKPAATPARPKERLAPRSMKLDARDEPTKTQKLSQHDAIGTIKHT